mgnify:CR=1 FL=1
MEGGALFNQGYLGQGFNWWVGQIADDSTWRDNLTSGKFKNKQQIKGWGYRYKVRIFGLHDLGEEAIPSKNLPWANVMYPVTAGGYQTNAGQTPNIRQGNIVFGFFLDGKEQQTPVIMGVLGNNAQTQLATAIGDSRVTNTKNGSVATSGYAEGQKPARPEETPLAGDSDKGVEKPKSTEQQQEEAPPSAGEGLNKYGLPAGRPITKQQLKDIRSAKHEAEEQELSLQETEKLIRKRVAAGVANRAKEANSPRSAVQPGATIESEAVHLQTAANLKLDAVYCKKRVMMKPTSLVESANKAIQIDMDNMTQLIDKSMNALTSYTDAVSRTREMGNLKKIISDGSKTQSKYMKIIMDNVMEYTQKKLNKEMTSAVSALPMSQRYKMLDLKDLMTQNLLSQYNGITGGMGGLMEGILNKMLKLDELTDAFEAFNNNDTSSSDPTQPKPLKGKPKVPVCASEDMVAAVMAASREEIEKTNNDLIGGIDDFIGDIQSQVAGVSGSMASLLSGLGSIRGNLTSALSFKNIKQNVFPFELPPNEAVSDYYTLCSGGAGQSQTQLPSFSAITEATNLVDRVIPDKEDKPGFATVPKNAPDVNLTQTSATEVDLSDDGSDPRDALDMF